jgi:MFS family permease
MREPSPVPTPIDLADTAPRAAVSRPPYLIYGLVYLMFMINYGDRAALSVAAPALTAEFSLSPSQMGWVLSSFLFTYSIANLPASILLDRFGIRTVGAISVALWSLAMILGGAAGTLAFLLGTRMLLGLGEAPTYSLSNKVVRIWAPAAHRGILLTILATGMHIGLAAAALLGTWLITRVGWRGEFFLLGLLGLVFSLVFGSLYREKPGSRDTASVSFRDVSAVLVVLKSRSFYSIVLAQCCGNYIGYLLIAWLPTFLIQTQKLTLLESGRATALCFALASVIAIGLTAVADRVGKRVAGGGRTRPFIAASLFLCGTAAALVPFVQDYATLVALVAGVMACSIAGCANVAALYSDLLIDGRRMGAVSGIIVTLVNVFGIGAPVITGYIVGWTGSFDKAFYFAAGLLVVAALSLSVVRHEPFDQPQRI